MFRGKVRRESTNIYADIGMKTYRSTINLDCRVWVAIFTISLSQQFLFHVVVIKSNFYFCS